MWEVLEEDASPGVLSVQGVSATPGGCARRRGAIPRRSGALRGELEGHLLRAPLDFEVRDPIEPSRQVPVPVTEHHHLRGDGHRARDRRFEHERDGDPEPHLPHAAERGLMWIRRWRSAVSGVVCQIRIAGIVHLPLVPRIKSPRTQYKSGL